MLIASNRKLQYTTSFAVGEFAQMYSYALQCLECNLHHGPELSIGDPPLTGPRCCGLWEWPARSECWEGLKMLMKISHILTANTAGNTILHACQHSHVKCTIRWLFRHVNVDGYIAYRLILRISRYQRCARYDCCIEVVCCHGAVLTTNEKPSTSWNKISSDTIPPLYPPIPTVLHILASPAEVSASSN